MQWGFATTSKPTSHVSVEYTAQGRVQGLHRLPSGEANIVLCTQRVCVCVSKTGFSFGAIPHRDQARESGGWRWEAVQHAQRWKRV
jgi:hypothetical protein